MVCTSLLDAKQIYDFFLIFYTKGSFLLEKQHRFFLFPFSIKRPRSQIHLDQLLSCISFFAIRQHGLVSGYNISVKQSLIQFNISHCFINSIGGSKFTHLKILLRSYFMLCRIHILISEIANCHSLKVHCRIFLYRNLAYILFNRSGNN